MSADAGEEISQQIFAKTLGLSQPQYSRYESQQRQPSVEIAMQIARKLGITLDELFYCLDESPSE
jgi:transcriptional regulator with XRE-family HTH domain